MQHLGPNGIVDGTNGQLTVVMLVVFFYFNEVSIYFGYPHCVIMSLIKSVLLSMVE